MGARKTLFGCVLVALLLLAACGAPTEPTAPAAQSTEPSKPASQPSQPQSPACAAKDCFVPLANDCKDSEIIVAEDAGVFKYSAKDCVFDKTLITLHEQETQEMKNLLQGKSLTCKYDKGKFDKQWTTSLVLGIEKCEGELKEFLIELLAFTS